MTPLNRIQYLRVLLNNHTCEYIEARIYQESDLSVCGLRGVNVTCY